VKQFDLSGDVTLTALMCADIYDNPAVVLRLLRAGADTTLRTASGKTALQLAKQKGHAECVRALEEHAAAAAAETAAAAATAAPCC